MGNNEKGVIFWLFYCVGQLLVLFNVWDVGSVCVVVDVGVVVLVIGSWLVVVVNGFVDGEQMLCVLMMEVLEWIVCVMDLFVIVDFESGYGEWLEDVVEMIVMSIWVGVIGCNFEDSFLLMGELCDVDEVVVCIMVVWQVVDCMGVDYFINVCIDVFFKVVVEMYDE